MLNETQSDGATLREHLQIVEQQTGRRPEQLIGPPMPKELEYIWSWFIELSNARGSTGMGPARLNFLEIDAWRRLTGINLRQFELDILLTLDVLYLRSENKQKG